MMRLSTGSWPGSAGFPDTASIAANPFVQTSDMGSTFPDHAGGLLGLGNLQANEICANGRAVNVTVARSC
jgi:hypothetical protein